jgi:hypothetical protein
VATLLVERFAPRRLPGQPRPRVPRRTGGETTLTLEVADEVPPGQRDTVRRHFDGLSDHDVHATLRRAHGGDHGLVEAE